MLDLFRELALIEASLKPNMFHAETRKAWLTVKELVYDKMKTTNKEESVENAPEPEISISEDISDAINSLKKDLAKFMGFSIPNRVGSHMQFYNIVCEFADKVRVEKTEESVEQLTKKAAPSDNTDDPKLPPSCFDCPFGDLCNLRSYGKEACISAWRKFRFIDLLNIT